ncbi:response regulator [Roseiconus lacunae]|uniref:Response regulator n=1 Tax=Roseiconus lacunae TaxID=2605694 RepID=A0ABT7PMZ9_9BACT|nr:response regulator [Roseiconus lacunae]MCD0462653.1 response regulator [Roseiconus lacunae]MDM4017853.1 response regulator [Roseiconus lacunae]WRQ52571.1 response regulator [Stieleria sp. HD01]
MFDSDKNITNSKILVIDDEQIVIDVITAHLNVAGYWNVVGICDSIDAAGRMKQESPDLVLVDISMPDVSGNYLLQIAQEDPILKNVPIIVVTGNESPEIHRRAIDLGAREVLTKPVDPRRLLKRVGHALESKFRSDETDVRQRLKRSKPANELYRELRGRYR